MYKIGFIFLLLTFSIGVKAQQSNLQKITTNLSEDFLSSNENQLVSPYSLYQLSSMLTNAAQQSTQRELIEYLGFQSNEIVLLNSYNIDLTKIFSKEVTNANALWYPKGYSLNTQFKKILEGNYQAKVKSGDFINKSEKIKNAINLWFYENTDYKINNMIDEISSMDKMIVMNALYFKSEWSLPFDKKKTYVDDFMTKSSSIKVEYLSQVNSYECYQDDKIKLILIPYQGNFEMMVWSLNDKEQNPYSYLSGKKLSSKKIELSVPKFILQKEVDCIELLTKSNVITPFQSGADFSFLFKKSEKDLFISKMIQKNYLKIDEEGTVAVAASMAKVSRSLDLKEYEEYKFNSTFFFIIQEKNTKEPLFIGKIVNPTLN